MTQLIGVKAIVDLKSFSSGSSKYISGISKMSKVTTSSTKSMVGGLTNLASSLVKVGAVAATALGAGAVAGITGLAAAIGSSTSVAADFEQVLSAVGAKSGATEADLASLKDVAQELGSTTSFSAVEAAQGMELLAQAGFTVNQIASAIPGTLSLAAAGNLELASAAEISADVLSAFGLEGEEAGRVADVLAATSVSASTDVEKLGQSMKFVAPKAADLGISIEDTATAIAVLSNAGIKSKLAGSTLRSVITRLTAPSDKTKSALSDLGVEVFDAQGKFRGLEAILIDLEKAFGPLTDERRSELLTDLAGTDAAAGLSVLLRSVNEDVTNTEKGFTTLNNKISEQGAAARIAEKQLDNLKGAITLLQSAYEGLRITIGDQFLPVFTDFIRFVTKSIGAIEPFAESFFAPIASGLAIVLQAFQGFSTRIGKLIGSTFTGFDSSLFESGLRDFLSKFKGAESSIGGIIQSIGDILRSVGFVDIVRSISGAFAFFVLRIFNSLRILTEGFRDLFLDRTFVDGFVSIVFDLETAWASFEDIFIVIFKNIIKTLTDKSFVKTFSNIVKNIKNVFVSIFEAVNSSAFRAAFNSIVSIIINAYNIGTSFLSALANEIREIFNSSDVTGGISTYVSAFLSSLRTGFNFIINNIVPVVSDVFNVIIRIISSFAGVISNIIGVIFGQVEGESLLAALGFDVIQSSRLGTILNPFIDSIKNLFATIFDFEGVGVQTFDNIGDAVKSGFLATVSFLITNVLPTLTSLINGLAGITELPIFSTISDFISQIDLSSLSDGLFSSFQAVQAFGSDVDLSFLVTTFKSLLEVIRSFITETDFSPITEGISSLFGSVLSFIAGIDFGLLINGFILLGSIVGGLVVEVFDFLVSTVFPLLIVGFGYISTAVLSLVNVISSNWPLILAGFLTVAKVVSDVLVVAFQTIYETALPPLQNAFIQLTGTLNDLGLNWGDVFSALGTATLIVAGIVGAALFGIILAAVSLVTAITSAISNIIESFRSLINAVKLIFEGLVGVFAGTFGIIKGILTGDIGLITNSFTVAFEGWRNLFAGIFQYIISAANLGLGTVLTIISSFIETGIKFFSDFANKLVFGSIIPDMITAIIDSFKSLLDIPDNLLTPLLSTISDLFLNAGWSEIVSNSLEGIYTGFKSVSDRVISLAESFVSKVLSSLERLTNFQLPSWVNDMPNALNRVGNAASNVRGRVGNAASGFRNFASQNIPSWLRMNSPPELAVALDEVASSLKSVPSFKDAFSGLTGGSLSGQISPSPSNLSTVSSSSTTNNSGPYMSQQNYISGVSDPDAVADIVMGKTMILMEQVLSS